MAPVAEDLLLELDELLHLPQEIRLDIGQAVQVIDIGAFAQGFVKDELAFAGRFGEQNHQLFQGFAVEVAGEAEAVAADLQRADRFLEGFLVVLADAHDFTDSPHLGAELILHALEFFKGPAGELDHNIVAGRGIAVEGAVAPIGDLIQGQAGGQHGRDQGDRETGRLGGQGGRTRGARIDFDDHDSAGLGIMGELDIGATDDLDCFDNGIGIALQAFLKLLADGQHRRRAERVAGMDPDRIDVLDEADRDHFIVGVADDLELELFPAEDRFFDQDLADHTGLDAALGDRLQFFEVIDQATTRAAHGIGRADDDRITELSGDGFGFRHGIGRFAARHLDAEPGHGFLESDAVLAALDGIDLDADHLDTILFEDTLLAELGAEIEG